MVSVWSPTLIVSTLLWSVAASPSEFETSLKRECLAGSVCSGSAGNALVQRKVRGYKMQNNEAGATRDVSDLGGTNSEEEASAWEIEDDSVVMRLEAAAEIDIDPADDRVDLTTTTVTPELALLSSGLGDVSCGGHRAATCAACPMGHGAAWCNGDCTWKSSECVLFDISLTDENPYGCPEPQNGIWPGGNCKARTCSIHFNFKRPQGARNPTWYYNEIVATDASSATYFATNTHGYGYAGIQMVSKDTSNGHKVLCSIWDQSTGNAKIETCGSGVSCVGFGGEGTGAKAIFDVRWKMGERYAWALRRADLPDGRVEHACWFYADELKNEYPGGWKHIATATSGRNAYGGTFSDSGAFLEQWTHENSQDLRRGVYGPAWYKNEVGDWQQSIETRFSSYYLQERLEKEQVRCDFVSAAVESEAVYMATGGLVKPDASEFQNPRDLEHLVASTNIPGPLADFNANAEELLKPTSATPAPRSTTVTTTTTTEATPTPTKATPLPTDSTPAPTTVTTTTTTEVTPTPTEATPLPTDSTPAPTPESTVSCGGHYAATCADCPEGYGAAGCNGDCEWQNGGCVEQDANDEDDIEQVLCGGHSAATCADCPEGHGASWCNGDCQWWNDGCVSKATPLPTDSTPAPTTVTTTTTEATPTPTKATPLPTDSTPAPTLGSTVSCGGHHAATCADCPEGCGAAGCNGDCEWQNGGCVEQDASDGDDMEQVLCGGHSAATCADCPEGHGASWCNGDCQWWNDGCVSKATPEGTPRPSGATPKPIDPTPPPTPEKLCKRSCSKKKAKTWSQKCKWTRCKGCTQCT